MKTSHYSPLVMAALLAVSPIATDMAQATVLIDLDLSSDTAHNTASGGIGDGTVNTNTNGYFTNINSTGNPAGRAFNTGATGMSTLDTNAPNVGTISWSNSSFNSLFTGATAFTTYLWLKPDTTPGSNAKLLDMGNIQLTLSKHHQLSISINGQRYLLYAGGVSIRQLGAWWG